MNDGVRDRDFTALQELKKILELVWAGIERSTQEVPPSASDTPNPVRFAVRLKESAQPNLVSNRVITRNSFRN